MYEYEYDMLPLSPWPWEKNKAYFDYASVLHLSLIVQWLPALAHYLAGE